MFCMWKKWSFNLRVPTQNLNVKCPKMKWIVKNKNTTWFLWSHGSVQWLPPPSRESYGLCTCSLCDWTHLELLWIECLNVFWIICFMWFMNDTLFYIEVYVTLIKLIFLYFKKSCINHYYNSFLSNCILRNAFCPSIPFYILSGKSISWSGCLSLCLIIMSLMVVKWSLSCGYMHILKNRRGRLYEVKWFIYV